MKYKKLSYILVLILMLIVGMNKTYAVQTYNDLKENDVHIQLVGNKTPAELEKECESLFGDKDNPESIRYLIDEILSIPRIIVPILIIILGMLDFGKAMIASKEDAMKKAQSDFIKRLIIGVAIFFIPAIVDLLMELADIVWAGTGYNSCNL